MRKLIAMVIVVAAMFAVATSFVHSTVVAETIPPDPKCILVTDTMPVDSNLIKVASTAPPDPKFFVILH